MDCSLIRPFSNATSQFRAHWILLNVKPLLRITFVLPQSVMKRMRLPQPFGVVMRFGELALPIHNPLIHAEMQVARGGEQMQMVMHQNVISNQPGIRSTPNVREQTMGFIASEPWNAVFCANRHKNNRRLPGMDMDALRWFTACLVGRTSR
jgi:hypothetical protein